MKEILTFHELDSLFGGLDALSLSLARGLKEDGRYPHDVYAVKDENGEVKGYGIDVALAGIPRENISVSTGGGQIEIKVSKTEPPKDRVPVETRISRKAASFCLKTNGLDLSKVEARFTDGMLTVTAPLGDDHRSRAVTIG